MNPLLIRFVIIGIGAAAAAFLAVRAKHSHKNNTNTGHQDAPPRTALCSVCLKDFSNFSSRLNLPCGHPLHPDCAKILFVQRENSCPSCRQRISPEFLRKHLHDEENTDLIFRGKSWDQGNNL